MLFIGSKSTISGFERKCVGESKSHGFRGRKPIISGFELSKIRKNELFPVLTGNAWAELKGMIIFDISEFDYVSFIFKIDHFGLQRAKNR